MYKVVQISLILAIVGLRITAMVATVSHRFQRCGYPLLPTVERTILSFVSLTHLKIISCSEIKEFVLWLTIRKLPHK